MAADGLRPVAGRDHCRGPAGGRYVAVEYGDYECPSCADAEPAVQELLRELGDDLCFAFRNFPLTASHPHAQAAAEAAEAAEMQGKFWLMHDRLFLHQDDLSPELIRRLARELPIELEDYDRDLGSGAPARRVAEDRELGRAAGVDGTPAFFLNGRRYTGEVDFLPLLNAVLGG